MATRLQKIILTLLCGTAIGVSRCHKPEVEHPPAPPPDVAADAGSDAGEAEPGPGPEPIAMPAYGVVAVEPAPEPPEMEDQPMYGVPVE